MIGYFKQRVVSNFNLVLALSVVIGLVVPGLEYLPKSTAMTLISVAIFFSCSRVTVEELRHINLKSALVFYVVRFVLLPLPVYWLARLYAPEYAMGIFLLTLIPVGASATTFASLCRANASLALSATVITNALAPFIMPALFYLSGAGEVKIDILKMFMTLGLGIFLPAVLYFMIVRRIGPLKLWVRRESHFYATMCIGGMMAAAVALEKAHILNNVSDTFHVVVLGCVVFALIYGVAWFYALWMPPADRRTYMICSGVNNTGIGIGLALLYFSPQTILFMIVSEIPWTIGLILFKKYADRHHE